MMIKTIFLQGVGKSLAFFSIPSSKIESYYLFKKLDK